MSLNDLIKKKKKRYLQSENNNTKSPPPEFSRPFLRAINFYMHSTKIVWISYIQLGIQIFICVHMCSKTWKLEHQLSIDKKSWFSLVSPINKLRQHIDITLPAEIKKEKKKAQQQQQQWSDEWKKEEINKNTNFYECVSK